jgi:2-octaprenyl-6-methoxyphenol hydroxylase
MPSNHSGIFSGTFDIVIVGGGLIGASLAHALSGQKMRVALLEAALPATDTHASYDDRAIALSQSSLRILKALKLDRDLNCTPIANIHISERGQVGIARISAKQEGVAALGAVTTARELGQCLFTTLPKRRDIRLLCPARLLNSQQGRNAVSLSVEHEGKTHSLNTRLLIAADGAQSPIRQQLGIATWTRDYQQTAIIANLSTELGHQNVAYERFTPTGPLALLPLESHRCALVCSVANADLERLLDCSEEAFLAHIQDSFGDRLGRLHKLSRRTAYPLRLLFAREHYRHRVALVGNAAHTLHPIAGQGFNLGLRDAAALADVLIHAQATGSDPGSLAVLRHYADKRRGDQRRAALFTDALAQLFRLSWPPLRLARTAGLLAFDLYPPAKHLLARHSMGLAPPLPRLAQNTTTPN